MTSLEKLLANIEANLRPLELYLLSLGDEFKALADVVMRAQNACSFKQVEVVLELLPTVTKPILASPLLKRKLQERALNLSLLREQLGKYSLRYILLQSRDDLIDRFVRLDGVLERIRTSFLDDRRMNKLFDEFLALLQLVQGQLSKRRIEDESMIIQQFSALSEKLRGINLVLEEAGKGGEFRRMLISQWNELIDLLVVSMESTQKRLHPHALVMRARKSGVLGIEVRA